MTDIIFKELGVVEYMETYDAMMELIASQPSFHSIWSLEHFPVFTIGISEKEIIEDKSKSPPFIKTDRGGNTNLSRKATTVGDRDCFLEAKLHDIEDNRVE